jgi:excisionase family DNA binding protein
MLPKLLKVPQVSKILCISRAMGYKLVSEGSLPAVKFGRTVRLRSSDIEKFILDNLTQKESERMNNAQPH